MTKIDQIAQAFAQGVKFAENLKLAMDAAKGNADEDGHWVTVGEGEEARPVFIKDKKKAAKTESKKAENKKAESKKSETKTKTKKSETPRAGLLTEQGSSLAQLAEREYDKVLTALKNNVGSINTDPTFPAGIKKYEAAQLKSILRNLKIRLSDAHNDLSIIKDMVSKAIKDGNFNQQGVSSVWLAIKRLKERAAYVVNRTYSETAEPGRHNTRGMKETAEALGSLFNEASGIRHDANILKEEVRGSIAQFERENSQRDA